MTEAAPLARRDVLRHYRSAPASTRLFLRVKLRICPLLRMERHYPRSGRIVDLGCGNGVFSNILKLGAPERDVLGFDLDRKKIAAARAAHAGVPDLEFRSGDIAAIGYPPADAYSIVDVLYLVPYEAQEDIVRRVHAALRPGGVLLLKDMDTRPRWKARWNAFQETVSVKVIGRTLGGRFYFRSAGDYERLLRSAGFAVETVRLDRGQWYPHILFVARKPA